MVWQEMPREPGDDSEVHPYFRATLDGQLHVAQVLDRDDSGAYRFVHQWFEGIDGTIGIARYRSRPFRNAQSALAALREYIARSSE